jgi:hypothetical protein
MMVGVYMKDGLKRINRDIFIAKLIEELNYELNQLDKEIDMEQVFKCVSDYEIVNIAYEIITVLLGDRMTVID